MPMRDPAAQVLIVDDQADVQQALRLLLKSEGLGCRCADGPDAALQCLRRESFDLALIDLNYTRDTTSGEEGLALLAALKKLAPEMPVVVMTAWGSIELVVRAMREGADDFIEKPWNNVRLLSILSTQIALGRSRRRAARLEGVLKQTDNGESFIAQAPSMRPLLDMLERVAPSDANVLILGENGTGKSLLAGELHRRSARAQASLVKVNMGAIAESVFESEMFGHVRGAFTDAKSDRIGRFELADGGTLFLDEIANIPLSQQPKLLRVLEDGEFERLGSSRTLAVDVRLISATNADLDEEIGNGRFRRDLLYRLNTVELRMPPLRERREDIAPMAHEILARTARRYRRDELRFTSSALRALALHAWPGNIRELGHVIERAVLMARGGAIDADDLDILPRTAAMSMSSTTMEWEGLTLDQVEQKMIRTALAHCAGNIQRAAECLGLSRPALYRRMEKFGLSGELHGDG